MTRKRDREQPPLPATPRPRRTFLGDEPWLEIANKLATLAALGFGVWAYFNTVEPVFEIQRKLEAERQRAGGMARDLAVLRNRGATLQQDLKEYQGEATTYRRGIVLAYLIDIRKDLQREAEIYRRLAPPSADLRGLLLARVDAGLTRLGSPPPGSIQSSHKRALEFVRRFVDQNIRQGAQDADALTRILDAYAQEGEAAGGGRR